MNNPIWVRENIGNGNLVARLPYQDPESFNKWLLNNIGKPEKVDLVVLFGLTMDCCVLCTAQELKYRGYNVKMLYEATDPMKNDKEYKILLVTDSPLLVWSGVIHFEELENLLEQ